MTPQLVVISGCSGGGKSTLLQELGRLGHQIFDEPGRKIVKEQLAIGGDALPWADVARFAERCVDLALDDIAAPRSGVAFCDRSLIDAVSGLEHMGLQPPARALTALRTAPYHKTVFLTPPWRELFATDAERRHGFADACAEYERLLIAYPRFGHEIVLVPKLTPPARADFILARLRDEGALSALPDCAATSP